MFKKATKKQSKLRLLLEGASGSGKTYSALTLAKGLGGNCLVIDTEKGSASLYAGKFDFYVEELQPPYTPEAYINIMKKAETFGCDVIIIDSITHEWSGQGGCLDLHKACGGQFNDWAKVTPRHNKFIEAILQSKCHIIATARTKSDYVVELNEKGKNAPKKVGLKTEQRDGLEYEFTTILRLNQSNGFEVSKDRTGLFQGREGVVTVDHATDLIAWLNDGELPEPAPELEPQRNITKDRQYWAEYKISTGPNKGLKFSEVTDKAYLQKVLDQSQDEALKSYLSELLS